MSLQENSWRKALVSTGSTIRDAVKNMNDSGLRIALVVDEFGHLIGTISDGDIRHGLLHGLSLDALLEQIVQKNPLVVTSEIREEMVLQLMRANRLQQVPIVDEKNVLIGLHLWDEISVPAVRSNSMVIMAGGKGTRLLPHTENLPKPMVELAGRPMLEHIIERAVSFGFTNFILAIHHLGHMIEDYFSDGSEFNVNISYVKENKPLGTAGALGLIDPVPDEPFIVTNGDVVSDIHYGELLDFHVRHKAKASMAVRAHEWQHPFGVVHTDGLDIVGFEEKPIARTHINAGVYALSPDTLKYLPVDQVCDMPMLFELLQADRKRTIAFPMHEPWLDVGRPDDLQQANEDLS